MEEGEQGKFRRGLLAVDRRAGPLGVEAEKETPPTEAKT